MHWSFMAAALLSAAACGGTASTDFPGDGGAGQGAGSGAGNGSGASGSGANGSGGSDICDCEIGAYVPVCGIDGNTYDIACSETCAPVPIQCEGECPCQADQCEDLPAAYADALARAKACAPQLPVEQCEQTALNELMCPCPTFVNGSNAGAVRELTSLAAEWAALGCNEDILCPDVECPMPSGARCDVSGGVDGTCADVFQ